MNEWCNLKVVLSLGVRSHKFYKGLLLRTGVRLVAAALCYIQKTLLPPRGQLPAAPWAKPILDPPLIENH